MNPVLAKQLTMNRTRQRMEEVGAIVLNIDLSRMPLYLDFEIGQLGEGHFLQVLHEPLKEAEVWKGRKWYISAHATESEIVMTALKAILTFLEHEVRETFRYKGKAIFDPHRDVEALLRIAEEKEFRAR